MAVRRLATRLPFRTKIAGALAGAGVLGLLAGKLWGYRAYQRVMGGGSSKRGPGYYNRRSFARLPRRKQRTIIYDKRAQLRDFEGIAYGPGYSPRYARRRRRRGLWGY